MVFQATRVIRVLSESDKRQLVFLLGSKLGSNGIKVVNVSLKVSIAFKNGLNHFSKLCAICEKF